MPAKRQSFIDSIRIEEGSRLLLSVVALLVPRPDWRASYGVRMYAGLDFGREEGHRSSVFGVVAAHVSLLSVMECSGTVADM